MENPIALQFIMQDDIFFLKQERDLLIYNNEPVAEYAPVTEAVAVEPPPVAAPAKPAGFNFMGKKGAMLILVHYIGDEHMQEVHLSALENILKRKEIALAEVAVLNMAKNSAAGFEPLMDYFEPQKVLIMGELALPPGIAALKLNQPQQLGKYMVLYSFSFNAMMASDENKRTFWSQMKNF